MKPRELMFWKQQDSFLLFFIFIFLYLASYFIYYFVFFIVLLSFILNDFQMKQDFLLWKPLH